MAENKENKWPMNPIDPVKVGDPCTGCSNYVEYAGSPPYEGGNDHFCSITLKEHGAAVKCITNGYKDKVVKLDGCERCIHCPANAKKGDDCPTRQQNHLSSKIGMSANMASACAFFVQRTCQNCAELHRTDCHHGCVDKSKWTSKAEPHQDTPTKTCGTCGMEYIHEHGGTICRLNYTHHGTCIAGKLWVPIPEAERKSGAAGNIASTNLGDPCPPYAKCVHVSIEMKRAEVAEKELAHEKQNWRAMRDERNALKAELTRVQYVEWPKTIADRDALKAKYDALETNHVQRAMYDAVENERNVLKARIDTWIDEHNKNVSLRKELAAAEARANAAEAKAKKLERDLLINTDFADDYHKIEREKGRRFCVSCGEPYRVEEEVMEPHVPRWARTLPEKCRGCEHACRVRNWENFYGADVTPAFCRLVACSFEPRYTRSQRRQMSMAGKLKKDKVNIDNLEFMVKEAERCTKEHRDAFDAIVAKKDAEIAKVKAQNDKDNTEWEEELHSYQIEHINEMEAHKKASVPLANAINVVVLKQEAETNHYGSWNYKVYFEVNAPVDFKDVVLYKKAKEEKTNGI
jgi:hypothetical protein